MHSGARDMYEGTCRMTQPSMLSLSQPMVPARFWCSREACGYLLRNIGRNSGAGAHLETYLRQMEGGLRHQRSTGGVQMHTSWNCQRLVCKL